MKNVQGRKRRPAGLLLAPLLAIPLLVGAPVLAAGGTLFSDGFRERDDVGVDGGAHGG
jgi:hypothetical protein